MSQLTNPCPGRMALAASRPGAAASRRSIQWVTPHKEWSMDPATAMAKKLAMTMAMAMEEIVTCVNQQPWVSQQFD